MLFANIHMDTPIECKDYKGEGVHMKEWIIILRSTDL